MIYFLKVMIDSKDELDRMQSVLNLDEKKFHQLSKIKQDEADKRIKHYKKQIINLSTTTKILSPLTAFIGVNGNELTNIHYHMDNTEEAGALRVLRVAKFFTHNETYVVKNR